MEKSGLKQEKLAEKAGLSLSSIANLRSGKTVRYRTAQRIAVGLGHDLQQLLAPEEHGVTTRIWLCGWPGVGKSTFLGALLLDEHLQAAFPGGVLSATLGPAPDILGQLKLWAAAFGELPDLRDEIPAWHQYLKTRLLKTQQRYLLLIDDAFSITNANAFLIDSRPHACVLTTRKRGLAIRRSSPRGLYELEILKGDYPLELLKRICAEVVSAEPVLSRKLVDALEGLPLAIQVAGRMLRAEAAVFGGMTIAHALARLTDLRNLLQEHQPTDTPVALSVNAVLRLSTATLSPDAQRCFAYLGAMPAKPAKVPLDALAWQWQDFDVDPEEMIRKLSDRGLMKVLPGGIFWVHALLVAHAEWLLDHLDGESDNGPTR